jgi:hypothetical protein
MGILNNSIVGTILAIMLIYALLSILVSILLEWWNQFKKTRAKHLKDSIETMIDGMESSKLAQKFYENYMVEGQTKGAEDKPVDHISDDLFAEAFTDVIANLKADATDEKLKDGSKPLPPLEAMKAGIDEIKDNLPLKQLLESFYMKAAGDYDKFVHQLKGWYNEFMERVSIWYKRAQRWKLLIAGLIVSIGLNVDSIFLFNVINKNATLRSELVQVAENVSDGYSQLDSVQKQDPNELLKTLKQGVNQIIDSTKVADQVVDTTKLNLYMDRLEIIAGKMDAIEQKKFDQTKEAMALVSDLRIPIGWQKNRAPMSWFVSKKDAEVDEESTVLKEYISSRNEFTFENVLLYLIGIFVTALSLSFGAPFWFQMLSKLVNIRRLARGATGKKK